MFKNKWSGPYCFHQKETPVVFVHKALAKVASGLEVCMSNYD